MANAGPPNKVFVAVADVMFPVLRVTALVAITKPPVPAVSADA